MSDGDYLLGRWIGRTDNGGLPPFRNFMQIGVVSSYHDFS